MKPVATDKGVPQIALTTVFQLLGDRRKKSFGIIAWLVVSALLDFFSLASFVPIILLLIQPGSDISAAWLQLVSRWTGLEDPAYIAVSLTVGALLFIAIKTLVQVLITHRKATYAYTVASDLASRAMRAYQESSYLKFTNTDYTRQMYRISDLPFTFANNIIIPLGTIISEALVSVLLLTCIAIYDPKVFFFLLLIALPLLLIYRMKRRKIKQISQAIKSTYPLLLKYTLQAVEGLLEMRTFRKERFFASRFVETHHTLGATFANDHTSATDASRFTELIAALCVGVLIIYAVLSRQSYSETLVLLGLYGGVSFRIIPSINRIFASSLQYKTHEYVVHELQNLTASQNEERLREPKGSLPFHNSIELRNITFGYEGLPPVLQRASLTIHKGEKVALRGKSGVGKTSLLLLLLRFVRESEGKIAVDGTELSEDDTLSWRNNLGYVSQNPYILDGSVIENIAFGIPPEQADRNRVQELIHGLDLDNWVQELPRGLDALIGEKGVKISGGQRQRLAIARALYQNAEILLLDEVTNQLDLQTEQEVMDLIHSQSLEKKTVIMITHHAYQSNIFDSIYELRSGRLEKVAIGATLTPS